MPLALVLKESFKIYCAINDGIISLVDKFFEMPRHEAIKALNIYKRAGQQPPQSFLVTMEEYVREAPRVVSVPSMALDYPERLMLTYKQEDVSSPSEDANVLPEKPIPQPSTDDAVSTAEPAVPPPPPTNLDTDDLLGLHVVNQDASAIEESNALALAIVPSGTTPFDSAPSQTKDFDPTGWELALVTTPSPNISSVQERQLAGGLDSLTLTSLYDNAAYRASHQPSYGTPSPNPFEISDPFAMPNTLATSSVQATMTHQNNPFASFQITYPQPQQHLLMNSQNPFGDTGFGAFPSAHAAQPPTTNPFGSTGLV